LNCPLCFGGIAFWNILRKDIKNYYLKPPNISWGIIFPLSWTLMQFLRTPGAGTVNIRELLSGLMSMSILFGTTSMLAVTITFERRSRAFDRLLLAPISMTTLVLAKISGTILFGVIIAFSPVLFAAFLTDLSGINWSVAVASILLMAVTSTLLGLAIAVFSKEVFEAQTYSNFFRFPMIFLSGLFLPIENLPAFLRPVSYCLPLTYGADMLKGAIMHAGHMNVWFDFTVLLGFAILLFHYCRWNIERKWIL
jgi:ABC-2 type transport system permease protein